MFDTYGHLYKFVIQEVINMDQKRVPLTVSLPAGLARKFEGLAKAEAKNRSQLFRDMFRAYEQRRREQEFFELQRYGVRSSSSPAWRS